MFAYTICLIFIFLIQICFGDPQGENVGGGKQVLTELPVLTNFTQYLDFVPNKYRMYYAIETPDVPVLHAVLVLNNSDIRTGGRIADHMHPWMSLGFGSSMLKAEFIVCHGKTASTNAIEIHEHVSTSRYEPPVKFEGSWAISPVRGIIQQGVFYCEFRRPLRPNDGRHANINEQDTSLMWAFNPQVTDTFKGKTFAYHEKQNRGIVAANLQNGFSLQQRSNSFDAKLAHGIGMFAVWLVLFPLSVFVPRFLKSKEGWHWIHAVLQTIGLIAIIVFVALIVPHIEYLTNAHGIIGILLLSALLIQFGIGFVNLLGFSREYLVQSKPTITLVHRYLGFFLLLFSVIQIYFGLSILYPWTDDNGRNTPLWPIYFFLIAFWLISFGAMQYFYTKKFENKPSTMDTRASSAETLIEPLLIRTEKEINKSDRAFERLTWKSLNERVEEGAMLVVANGKYVYDISRWISSHPGGQLILKAVNGTDITADYFREAGFDAEEFTPMPSVPEKKMRGRMPSFIMENTASIMSPSINGDYVRSVSGNGEFIRTPALSEEDWKFIAKARRTHVHTKLAIQKLSQLIVGEMDVSDRVLFDPFEFRRYALTEKTLMTTETAPVLKLKFCLLYPHELRENEPDVFYPGQCIEIQCRIQGKSVSRYYAPIKGSLVAFELYVKVKPNGLMSNHLAKEMLGVNQFKIRGPFGKPLFSPMQPLFFHSSHWTPPVIFAFVAGSGLTPILQLLNYMFLSTFEPLTVIRDYQPAEADELFLQGGDLVMPTYHYEDGWAFGTHLKSGRTGVFPLSIVSPKCGLMTKVIVLNFVSTANHIFGGKVFQACQTAYPQQVEYHHFVSDEMVLAGHPNIHAKTTLQEIIEEWVSPRWGMGRQEQKGIVCGPPQFNSDVMDTFIQMGFDTGDLKVMLPDRFLEI